VIYDGLIHEKSHVGEKTEFFTLLGALVSPSQEAFTMLLYKIGF
jgi:hypothetical protein